MPPYKQGSNFTRLLSLALQSKLTQFYKDYLLFNNSTINLKNIVLSYSQHQRRNLDAVRIMPAYVQARSTWTVAWVWEGLACYGVAT